MTAIRTENDPRYSSTSRNDQLLKAYAAHSHIHSKAMNGVSHFREALGFLMLHGSGRFLGECKIMEQPSVSACVSQPRRNAADGGGDRSEERRVGKECR